MNNKEIEKELKESAEKVEIKDFESRREAINARINAQKKTAEEEVFVLEAVGGTADGVNSATHTGKPKWIMLAFLAACVVALAIILPVVLRKDDPDVFYDAEELISYNSTEEELYSRLEEGGIKIADTTRFEIQTCYIIATAEDVVKGGKVEFLDEENGFLVTLTFYDISVSGIPAIEENYSEHTANGVTVRYKTAYADELYTGEATAQFNGVNYYFEILSVDENLTNLFNSFFQN